MRREREVCDLRVGANGRGEAMTAEDFERGYAERSGISLEELRRYRKPVPCNCGEAICEGWAMLPIDIAEDLEAEKRGASDVDY
jgi:hypothetical protein